MFERSSDPSFRSSVCPTVFFSRKEGLEVDERPGVEMGPAGARILAGESVGTRREVLDLSEGPRAGGSQWSWSQWSWSQWSLSRCFVVGA